MLAQLAQNGELVKAMTALLASSSSPAQPVTPPAATAQRPGITVRELAKAHWRGEGYAQDSANEVRSRGESALKTFIPSQGIPFGDMDSSLVDGALLREYRRERERHGKTRLGTPPKPATRNREVALIRRWFSYGHEEGLGCKLLTNIPQEKENNVKKGKIASEEMLSHFLDCCDQVGAPGVLTAMVLSLVDTGMRSEEVRELRWDGFDHKTGRIALLGEETKGEHARVPRLTPRCLSAVLALPRLCEHVFASEKHKRVYSERHVKQMFDDAMKLSGIQGPGGEKITMHALRHSFVYKARRHWNLARDVIKKMTGHKTDSAFIRYGIVDAEEVDEAFDRRDEILAALEPRRHQPRKAPEDSAPPGRLLLTK